MEIFENLSVILTVRIESRSRFENMCAVIAYYAEIVGEENIFILEADRASKCEDWLKENFPHVRYHFVQDDNRIFHRTHYINEQLRMSTSKLAAVIDADVIVPQQQLAMAVAAVQNGNILVLPYDGRFVSCDKYYSDIFRKSHEIRTLTAIDGYRMLMFGFVSVGGAFIIDIASYRRCGWENEHFIGWGCEDFERVHRLEILGYPPVRIPGMIYHLEHPRGINSGDMVDQVVLSTKREYSKVCSMNHFSLQEYVDSWPWC